MCKGIKISVIKFVHTFDFFKGYNRFYYSVNGNHLTLVTKLHQIE